MDLYASLSAAAPLSLTKTDCRSEKISKFYAFGNSCWVSTPIVAQFCLTEPAFKRANDPSGEEILVCGETLRGSAGIAGAFPKAEVWNNLRANGSHGCNHILRITQEIIKRYSPLPVGKPKPDCEIHILENGADVKSGERGEIVIAGQTSAQGTSIAPI